MSTLKLHAAVTDERRLANQKTQLEILLRGGFIKSTELRHCELCERSGRSVIAEVFLVYGPDGDDKLISFCRECALWAKQEIQEELAEVELADEEAEER